MARLSKSRILSALQCPRKAHLEARRPELAQYSAQTLAAFETGHEVGDLAIQLYGGDSGVYIEYSGGAFTRQLAQTAELMSSMFRTPIFEATLEHDGVLVREDVLLPMDGNDWRVVEVKSSTSVKDYYVHDCAVQYWVHRGAGHALGGIALAHVDRGFVYRGDGDYSGLLVEQDLSEQVNELQPSVPGWVRVAREAIDGPEPQTPVGQHCTNPHECPFIGHCWPGDTEYPIRGLRGSAKKLGVWVMNGCRDIRDVPADQISSETQLRIHRVTLAGAPELLPGAQRFMEELAYPRFYLDFETVGPAIPLWGGTRPYQAVPFQWSCHIERAPGTVDHAEFIDLDGGLPARPLARALIDALEGEGPVLMWSTFERQVISGLIEHCPDLAEELQAIIGRLVDLLPVVKANYYHPDMLGSWSIKAVLPTIAADMDYSGLEGIHEGTEASSAYREAIDTETAPERREQLRGELLAYCRHDTEAMVRLVHFFQQR